MIVRVPKRGTANDRYWDHTGTVIRFLNELDGKTVAYVRWDSPYPVDDIQFQIMELDKLVNLLDERLDSLVIQEEE